MALVRRARKQYLRAHFPLRRRIDCRCGNIRVGPNDGVKITCHPDADPTSPTSYLMPSPTSYLMQLVPAVCAAALTVSCAPHGIRLGRRVGRIPIVSPVQLSETGDMLGAASLKRRSASAMSAACADCVLMLSRSSRVAASPS